MNLLKKIGTIALKVVTTWTGLEDVVRVFARSDGTVDKISETMLEVRDVIITVEEIAALTTNDMPGPEKLKIAGPLVGKVILRSALVADRKVKDEALFLVGSTKIAAGTADMLNSLSDDGIDEDNHG